MDKKIFDEYLLQRYKKEISWYSSKARKNKKMYFIFQTTIIVLSSLTPVLIVLEEVNNLIPAIISI
jgi:hypothetical protein